MCIRCVIDGSHHRINRSSDYTSGVRCHRYDIACHRHVFVGASRPHGSVRQTVRPRRRGGYRRPRQRKSVHCRQVHKQKKNNTKKNIIHFKTSVAQLPCTCRGVHPMRSCNTTGVVGVNPQECREPPSQPPMPTQSEKARFFADNVTDR